MSAFRAGHNGEVKGDDRPRREPSRGEEGGDEVFKPALRHDATNLTLCARFARSPLASSKGENVLRRCPGHDVSDNVEDFYASLAFIRKVKLASNEYSKELEGIRTEVERGGGGR